MYVYSQSLRSFMRSCEFTCWKCAGAIEGYCVTHALEPPYAICGGSIRNSNFITIGSRT
jgi:hypothetical protein